MSYRLVMAHPIIPFLSRAVLRMLYGVKVYGTLEHHEKLLIVSNHQSFLDGALLGAFLPVMPVWLMHSSIASRWYFRIPMKLFPYLVVDTANPLAMKQLVALVESGTPVMIFAEGRITATGALMKVYDGPAWVAARTGAAVVPVHIDGPQYTFMSRMSGDFPRKWFPRITLTIGEPRRVEMPVARTAKLRRRLASERLRRILQESMFAARRRTTLFEAFLDAVDLHGRGRDMLEDIRQTGQTYGDLLKASLALGRLTSKFTREDEHVGVLMPNAGATACLLNGLMAWRRVPAILNYTSGLDGMQSACRMSQVKTVITSRAFLEKARLEATVARLAEVRIVYIEDLRPSFTLADKLWLVLWALRWPRRAIRPGRPEDPAVVLFTSGSEGRPKGVVLSHDAILANIAQIHAVIAITTKDKFLSCLPMFHAFGLTVGVFLPLTCGARVFLYPSPLHYRIIPEMAYDRNCTVVFATNTFLGNYAKHAHPYDLRSVRYVGTGAEKLSEDVRAVYAEKFGVRIIEGYGATECAPIISLNTPLAFRMGTVGELLPGMEAKLEPVAGIEDAGLLHVRGPNLMLGYLRESAPGRIEPPSSAFGDGWYPTGDVVSMDADGFLTIRGRMKRFAKVAGEMVSLETAEAIAVAASPNAQHAAVAVEEPGRGEVIVLYTEDAALKREALKQAARELGLPELALARRVVHLKPLPLLGNGKKDYVTLNRLARA
jgi:acyl-[acyl-carrier-protein]-phospholipid O-acyltransferase/long-chain-fatty-acid--[acyl-carrier-protein] ligase